jgi:nonspecific dipeptidase
VAVQSVSAWPEKREEIKKMMDIAAKDIERLGGTVEMVDNGKQKVNHMFQFHLLSTPGRPIC